jgi:hypothetical protein
LRIVEEVVLPVIILTTIQSVIRRRMNKLNESRMLHSCQRLKALSIREEERGERYNRLALRALQCIAILGTIVLIGGIGLGSVSCLYM